MARFKKRKKGFTLVELLLVVAILAVLAFLAGPAIANSIRTARVRTCASNEIMGENSLWRWYADQVAAGKSVLLAAGGMPTGALASTDVKNVFTLFAAGGADATIADDDLDDIDDYFHPAGYPKCPFNQANVYNVVLTFNTDGGLNDILCVCSGTTATTGAHDRAPDRIRETEGE